MSNSSKRAAAAAKGKDVPMKAQAREARLAAAEGAATQAAQAAAQAAEAAQAAVGAATALRQEIEDGKPAGEGSERFHTPERRRHHSPSPDRRHRRRGRSPVVQVYRDIGGGWPMLTRANYHEWSLLMKVKLQARGLWEATAASSTRMIAGPWRLCALRCRQISAPPSPTSRRPSSPGRRSPPGVSAVSAFIAPRCSGSVVSRKASPFSPVSKLRTLLFA